MERLKQLVYRDRARALREISGLSQALPAAIANRLDLLLSGSPAPEEGLRYFARLHELRPDAFQRLATSTNALQYLTAVFTNSDFLSEEVLRHPEWAEELSKNGRIHSVLTSDEFRSLLEAVLPPGPASPLALAQFRRRQLLRILVRDVLGLGTLPEITGELTALADAILEAAYARIYEQLVREYGEPGNDGKFAVLALGKMGGEELNYSSDIDLIFLYSANGETSGAGRSGHTQPPHACTNAGTQITNKEFFKLAANRLTSLLSTYTAEGRCYRVDLRLRPEGSLGDVCISLEGARHYYEKRARDWELQMMIKARVCAGDRATGRALLDFVEPRTYSTTLDFSAIEALSATRERLNEKLSVRSRSQKERKSGYSTARRLPLRSAGLGQTDSAADSARAIDVKLERGGIRDIEFLVQCLQRLFGGSEPWVRHGGTLLALARLHDKRLISEAEYGRLASAYQFLRILEHRLQFAEDRQTHTLPIDSDALELIAKRMPGADTQDASGWLLKMISMHFENVREIYNRVVYSPPSARVAAAGPAATPHTEASQEPARPREAEGHGVRTEKTRETSGDRAAGLRASLVRPNIVRALEQRAPVLFAALNKADLRRGYAAFEHFLERISGDPERLGRLNADPELAAHTLDIFEHSPHFAEELIRTPELLDAIANLDSASATSATPPSAGELRRWYRREMLRAQAASICLSQPIFETLAHTSELADAVIARAYEIAIREVSASRPPAEKSYHPSDQMWVIALGRLGMREFDMASDADLVFVLRDRDAPELQFWTRVAERVVQLITAYTGEGVLFAVDTRLRPNGGDGPLVQTESAYKDYFGRSAEAWEGITYMKSRAVAGDPDAAEFFLHELQEIDWKRYGQSGRSRTDLKQMRMKLEREQGAAHPFKSGRGGYYDIDFILMYLRLKNAGVFFTVLNTPARIEVIESMGLLDHRTAEFLNQAATFYRALDHGIRILTGHSQDRLPTSEAQLEALSALVQRWTPVPLEDVDRIRSKTRALFEEIFG